MAFMKVCTVDDLGERGMTSRYLMDVGVEVLVVRDRKGDYHAYDGVCPHEDFPLVEGDFDGATITCIAHGWIMSAFDGKGVNPATCKLTSWAIKLEGDDIHVDFDEELAN